MAGLNNQKLAFLGLFFYSFENRMRLNLPAKIVDLSASDIKKSSSIFLSDVFDLVSINNFIAKYDLLNFDDSNEFEIDWSAAFSLGVSKLKLVVKDGLNSEFVRDFLAEFKASKIIRDLSCDFHNEYSEDEVVAVQLRIEKDWKEHTARKIANDPNTNILFFDHLHIFEKISNTPSLRGKRNFMAFCDSSALLISLDEIKNQVRDRFGYNLYFTNSRQKDSISSSIGKAAFDFELGLAANSYVGLSSSTFSNVLCATKYSSERKINNHFIYNNPKSSSVILRKDFGLNSSPDVF